jgi:hypothetical protein
MEFCQAPTIILTIFFWKVNTLPLLDELPQKYSSLYYGLKMWGTNVCETVNVANGTVKLTV